MLLSLQVLGWISFWITWDMQPIPAIIEEVVAPRDQELREKGYFRNPIPLPVSVMIPKGTVIRTFFGVDRADKIVMSTTDKTTIVLSDSSRLGLFSNYPTKHWEQWGFESAYQFANKYYSERFGVMYVALRGIGGYVKTTKRIHVEDITLFLQKTQMGSSSSNAQIHIFYQGDAIGEIIFGKKNKVGEIDDQLIENVISSVIREVRPSKSEEEFTREGRISLEKGDFEKAKFSFASALYLNWAKASHHYNFGRSLFEAGSRHLAKGHLKDAMEIQPVVPEAQELIKEIESKEEKE